MLVEGRLEPGVAQSAAFEPVRRDPAHLRDHLLGVDVGRAEQFERAGGAPALAQRRAFQHHRAGIGPRHVDVGGIGAGIDPDPLRRPAEAGRIVGRPAVHLDHPVIQVEVEMGDEPAAHLPQSQPVPHRHRTGADEAFPAGAERQPLDRSSCGIGAIEHPDRLPMPGRRLEHVEQGGDEGVDPAADILEIDQDHIECAHALAGRAADLAIEAEHRDVGGRIGIIRRFHHIVLEIAANPVLRAEHRRDVHPGGDQRVEAVGEVRRHRGGMGEQGDALALQRPAQLGLGEQTIDTEFHAPPGAGSVSAKQSG